MTRPRRIDHRLPPALFPGLRLALAGLLALVLALLPGPGAPEQAPRLPGQAALFAHAPTLTALHGRELLARKDAMPGHLVPIAALPGTEAPQPPSLPLRLSWSIGTPPCPGAAGRAAPCARAPPLSQG